MNNIYKLVWSKNKSAWIAVSECTRGVQLGSGASKDASKLSVMLTVRGFSSLTVLALGLVGLLGLSGLSFAGPAGGVVTSGDGKIVQTNKTTTTIQQNSSNLSLNWNSFNISATETVNFVQPSASSIAINTILGNSGSQIQGKLNANGQVWLINPNGVLFGSSSQVNVGGLVASTLAPTALGSGGQTFSGSGQGSVINQGTLTATNGGYVALIANTISNQGTITTNGGTAALGAGSSVTLKFAGNSLLGLQVDQNTLNNLAENKKMVQANGGQVIMSAGAKDSVLASVVNNTGVVQARTVKNVNGKITLLSGMTAGTTTVAGTLDASAPNGGDGGSIETSGSKVKVANGTKISTDASKGQTGTWTLDPVDINIAATGGDISGTTIGTTLATTNVVLSTTPKSATDLTGTNAGLGDINVKDTITWTSGSSLTLNADNNVNINSAITLGESTPAPTKNSQLIINAYNNINFNNTVTVQGKAAINLNPGKNNASADGISTGNDIFALTSTGFTGKLDITSTFGTFNATANPTLKTPVTSALTIKNHPYTIFGTTITTTSSGKTYVTGNQDNFGNNLDILDKTYIAFGKSIDWSSIVSYSPGDMLNSSVVDGLGHTLTMPSYTIALPTDNTKLGKGTKTGWFSTISQGTTLQNFGLSGGLVTAYLNGAVNTSTSNINGIGFAGSLAGINKGTIFNTYSSENITGIGTGGVGGLIGGNSGKIIQSFYSGVVTGQTNTIADLNFAGGLVGGNGMDENFNGTKTILPTSSVTNSYTTNTAIVNYNNNISNFAIAGGFVGMNYAVVANDQSAATINGIIGVNQAINAPFGPQASFGGLVGNNQVLINQSSSNGKISVTINAGKNSNNKIESYLLIGGLVGSNGDGCYQCSTTINKTTTNNSYINNSSSNGLMSISFITSDFTGVASTTVIAGGLSGDNAGTIFNSFSQSADYNTAIKPTPLTIKLPLNIQTTNNTYTISSVVGGLVGNNRQSSYSIPNSGDKSAYGLGLINGNSYSNYDILYTGNGTKSAVGGLVGINDGIIDGINNKNPTTLTVTGDNIVVGGLVGAMGINYTGAKISNSSINAIIKSTGNNSALGGAVGVIFAKSGEMNNITSTGSISSTGNLTHIGGIVGSFTGLVNYDLTKLIGPGTISNVTSSVAIDSSGITNKIGGILGNYAQANNIDTSGYIGNAFATGDITVSDVNTSNFPTDWNSQINILSKIGGLIGVNSGKVGDSQSSNKIKIKTGSGTGMLIGGLIGENDGYIISSNSTSNINYKSTTPTQSGYSIGGLVGANLGNIDASFAKANFESYIFELGISSDIGGLAGSNDLNSGYGKISNSYSINKISFTNSQSGFPGWPNSSVGGLVGLNAAQISNSYSYGEINAQSAIKTNIGGLVGYLGDDSIGKPTAITDGYIVNSYSNINISSTGTSTNLNSNNNIGGLVGLATIIPKNGSLSPSNTISNSYSVGSIVSNDASSNVGGLIGSNADVVSTTYSATAISGSVLSDITSKVDAFIGNNNGSVSTSYFYTPRATRLPITSKISGVKGLSAEEAKDVSKWQGFSFASTTNASSSPNKWVMFDPYSNPLSSGSNAITLPMLASEFSTNINGGHQLQLMALDKGRSYKLINSIDLSGTKLSSNDIWTASGFVPIGNLSAEGLLATKINSTGGNRQISPFSGSLDGQGFNISNLNINNTVDTTNQGRAFGLIGVNSGTITNVNLSNSNINILDNTESGISIGIGSLAGYNLGSSNPFGYVKNLSNTSTYGIVNNSSATGSIVFKGGPNVGIGGLVGVNDGVINNSFSSGQLNSFGNMVAIGGLVGLLSKNSAGTISSSNSSSLINSSGVYVAAGGLVGDEFSDLQYINYGLNTRIQDSFSSGSVNLKDTNSKPENVNFGYGNFIIAGGLIGHNIGTITNSHSTSNVSVNTNIYTTIMMGGLSGFNEGASDMTPVYNGSISNSYSLGKLSFTAQNPSLVNVAIGGLSGLNAGNIELSYAIKNFDNPLILGPALVGGLVGSNGFGASISKSYSVNDIKFSSAANLTDSIKYSSTLGLITSTKIGGLSGGNAGLINASYSRGSITQTSPSTGSFISIGGLVGGMDQFGGGGSFKTTYISDSYSNETITSVGSNNYVGGLVGSTKFVPTSGGQTTADKNGSNLIERSYAIGSISSSGANSRVGGLIGINVGDAVNTSYASVKIINTDSLSLVGGLIGENRQNTVYASDFWDTSLNVGLSAVGKGNQGGSTGLNTTQIRTLMTWPLNKILTDVQSPDLYASFNPLNLAPLK